MGQTYTVEGLFRFKNNDSSAFCKSIKDYIEEMVEHGYAVMPKYMSKCNLADPKDVFQMITCGEQFGGVHTFADENGEEWWVADFEASYGWESILDEAFQEALRYLDEGSTVIVYPDHGHWFWKVKDGSVVDEDGDANDG